MQNYEGIVLFWLLPSDPEQEDRSADLIAFRGIINDTRIFHDVDECIATLSSIADETVFLVLGSGRSYLMSILSSFTDLHYIYLSEPHDCAYTSQVRGVFHRKQELLYQLKKDVKFVDHNGAHITL